MPRLVVDSTRFAAVGRCELCGWRVQASTRDEVWSLARAHARLAHAGTELVRQVANVCASRRRTSRLDG